jgi:uncharacterized protein VirK/YbjX
MLLRGTVINSHQFNAYYNTTLKLINGICSTLWGRHFHLQTFCTHIWGQYTYVLYVTPSQTTVLTALAACTFLYHFHNNNNLELRLNICCNERFVRWTIVCPTDVKLLSECAWVEAYKQGGTILYLPVLQSRSHKESHHLVGAGRLRQWYWTWLGIEKWNKM